MKPAAKRARLVGAGVAGKMGGDPWVALVLFPCRFAPAPHGRRKRPHSTPHLSRPYECDDLPQIPTVEGEGVACPYVVL